jgi:putative membrane protein
VVAGHHWSNLMTSDANIDSGKEGFTMPMLYGWNGNWGAMALLMLVNVAVWIVLVGLLIWGLTRLVANRTSASGPNEIGPSALEILRQRYARGEIDSATFDDMQRRVRSDGFPPQPITQR